MSLSVLVIEQAKRSPVLHEIFADHGWEMWATPVTAAT
jgi:hypothetical protein